MPKWNPSDYRNNSSQQQKWAREVIAKLKLRGDERVLDIGSGDGKVTAEIARQLPRGSIMGLDSSAQMVEFAQSQVAGPEHPNLSFQHGDASGMMFDQEFDLVFSNATLHWIPDHRPVLEGIARALRPGGRFVAQMGGKGCADDVRAVLNGMMAAPRWREHFIGFSHFHAFYSPEEYRPWLDAAGLQLVRIDLFPKDMTHTGKQGLAGWLRTTWMQYIHAVPADQQETFLAELVEKFIAASPIDEHGLAHVAMVRLEVEAIRPA